ncbi:hypothetical protein F441_17438 [Phytophthora nicotianae CJ01A1]|uniref:Uncharacterized protein n=2 Tax=Phytophthora nicotianae TaxID=4792 RepID=W2G0F1_PHYNI|nr:hypothetical protein L915_17102 [Phytophthora nicotianae]ETL29951.1 hypothetical protein L916_16998 [Phytophthora nicotianae]ETL83193.1 hypothetical protein L917_16826 [Phytophthora nicotianae]ETP06115.1 hypothetical protein F441_17438 [Phytophthora nicotianae CJ01A1]
MTFGLSLPIGINLVVNFVLLRFCQLYLLGRSRLNCENRSISSIRDGKKAVTMFFCCQPVLLAPWVAVTRSIDNQHHYSDHRG